MKRKTKFQLIGILPIRFTATVSILFFFLIFKSTTIFAQPVPVNIGDNITDTLQFIGDVNSYSLCVAAGVQLRIRANSTDINSLRVEVRDSEGDLVASDWSSGLVSILQPMPTSAEYTIQVEAQYGNDMGEYFFSLQRIINPVAATPLVCNSANMDSLELVTEAKSFNFSVIPGATININLSSSEINTKRMELYNSLGNQIASDWSSGVVQIQTTLTEPGCYSLFVMSQYGNDVGSFSLALNIITGACTSTCTINEICDNQIDDDGDGSIDCSDPDCCNFPVLNAAIDGNLEFCEGENSTLTASGGIDYNWSTGENTASIFVSNPGSYTVTVTNDNACMDIETVTIIVNNLPTVDWVLAQNTFCIDESNIQLIGGLPTGGTYSGAGVTGDVFEPSEVGVGTHVLTYTFTDSKGCMNDVSQEISVVIENGTCTNNCTPPNIPFIFAESDVYIKDACYGVIMTSPNGSCFRIKVADSGTLITESITCP